MSTTSRSNGWCVLLDPELQLVSARSGDSPIPWSAGPTAAVAPTRVTLRFPEAIRQGERVIRLGALGRPVLDRPWRLPRIRPEGLFWQEGGITLLVSEPLLADRVAPLECGQTAAGPLSAPRAGESMQFQLFGADATVEVFAFAPSRKGPPWRKKRAKCRYFCGQHGSTTVGLGVELPSGIVVSGRRPIAARGHLRATARRTQGPATDVAARNRPRRTCAAFGSMAIRPRGACSTPRKADAFRWNFPPIGSPPRVTIEWTAGGSPLGVAGRLAARLPEPNLPVLSRHWTVCLPPDYEPWDDLAACPTDELAGAAGWTAWPADLPATPASLGFVRRTSMRLLGALVFLMVVGADIYCRWGRHSCLPGRRGRMWQTDERLPHQITIRSCRAVGRLRRGCHGIAGACLPIALGGVLRGPLRPGMAVDRPQRFSPSRPASRGQGIQSRQHVFDRRAAWAGAVCRVACAFRLPARPRAPIAR